MPQAFDKSKVLATNPQVSEKGLSEALAALHKLRQLGIAKKGYNLVLPFSRRRPQPKESTETSRVYLRSRS